MRRPRDAEIVRLREIVRDHLERDAILDLVRVARSLGTSPRTLQRKLVARGTSFRAIVQDVRCEVALGLLAEGLTVARVSVAVGYSDPKALRRAFHRWGRGMPSTHRTLLARSARIASGEPSAPLGANDETAAVP